MEEKKLLRCPKCGAKKTVAAALEGQSVCCPKCREVFVAHLADMGLQPTTTEPHEYPGLQTVLMFCTLAFVIGVCVSVLMAFVTYLGGEKSGKAATWNELLPWILLAAGCVLSAAHCACMHAIIDGVVAAKKIAERMPSINSPTSD